MRPWIEARKRPGIGNTSWVATETNRRSPSSRTSGSQRARSGLGRQVVFTSAAGNGRNFVPLVKRGIELTGLDISATAIAQLRERLPERSDSVIHGDLTSTALRDSYPIVIGIQVFQHGSRAESHSHLALAKSLVAADGLFCLRVNATSTDVWPTHEVVERSTDDGFTVRYLEGPRRRLYLLAQPSADFSEVYAMGATATG